MMEMMAMFKPCGYYIGSGYIGFLPDNKRMQFPTEREYLEYVLHVS